jgi:hypothetical protein
VKLILWKEVYAQSEDLCWSSLKRMVSRASGVAQVVECLLSKGEALSSNLSIAQKKKGLV